MKQGLLIVIFLGVLFVCSAQKSAMAQNPKQFVKIKNWEGRSFLFTEDFWKGKKEQIETQMGEGAFESVKKFSHFKNIPPQMSISNGPTMSDPETYYKKLSNLKNLYRVASFNHIFHGQDFGNYVIIQVPYIGNENWDTAAKWHTVYFIFEEKDVEIK